MSEPTVQTTTWLKEFLKDYGGIAGFLALALSAFMAVERYVIDRPSRLRVQVRDSICLPTRIYRGGVPDDGPDRPIVADHPSSADLVVACSITNHSRWPCSITSWTLETGDYKCRNSRYLAIQSWTEDQRVFRETKPIFDQDLYMKPFQTIQAVVAAKPELKDTRPEGRLTIEYTTFRAVRDKDLKVMASFPTKHSMEATR